MAPIVSEFRLSGPQGNNPLGFLTALGSLVVLSDGCSGSSLRWDGLVPCLRLSHDDSPRSEDELVNSLYAKLHRVREQDEGFAHVKKAMDQAKTAVKKKAEEIKKRQLGRADAKGVRLIELEPLRAEFLEQKSKYRVTLRKSAADPSLILGKNLTESNADFVEFVILASEGCSSGARRDADLASAFGVGDPNSPADTMKGSPWALIRGDGRQNFLETVEQLMVGCTAQHLKRVLFGPWSLTDEKYSLRLDPCEDRRYALIDRNPTGTGNEPKTSWGANRLAFEAFRVFPAVPIRTGMGVLAWRKETCVRWPLWTSPLGIPVIQSLMSLPDLWLDKPAHPSRLRGIGVHTVMESQRMSVGKKFSLSPATPVFIA